MANEKQNERITNNAMPLDLDLSNDNKSTSKRPKPYLKCVVCGDDAYGYNFDAISCESCKAFFRRNALRPPDKLKCRGDGHCAVTVETRKRCKRCRLDKCFRSGMRKEWILSDDEKRRKRRRVEENRLVKQPQVSPRQRRRHRQTRSRTDDSSSEETSSPHRITPTISTSLMTEFEWSKIQQIQAAYSDAVAYNQVSGVPPYPAIHSIHTTLDLIRVPTYLSSIRLITYFKKTPEFSTFDSEDRVTLVKYNLLAVVFMHIVLIYDPVADTYHEYNTEDPIFQGTDWIEIFGEELYHELTATAIKLIQILQYDRVIVKLLLLIILFNKGFCGYDILHEPTLNNCSIVIKTQDMFIEVLYKYCVHQYGWNTTTILFTNLIGKLFSIQSLSLHLKDLVHSNIDASDLSPLMQSVLQLSAESTSS